ncbi:hypothetical protein IE986_13255 [Klebsiella pneumoniae]|uniref:Uncharacterized protein n=1 Tax=Klebsiella pneumoniae TaxID=573 RepID=A0A927DA19_KLEPN|nr:hypothetical protein [Klebsiella pneumoniae]
MPDLLLQFCRPGKAPAATRHKAAPCPAALRMPGLLLRVFVGRVRRQPPPGIKRTPCPAALRWPGLLLRFCRPGKAPAATRQQHASM